MVEDYWLIHMNIFMNNMSNTFGMSSVAMGNECDHVKVAAAALLCVADDILTFERCGACPFHVKIIGLVPFKIHRDR